MFVDKLIDSVRGFVKIALQSRSVNLSASEKTDTLIILANGPSLNDTIDAHGDLLRTTDTLAVNFAANAPVFRDLKPKYYVLADPHFFSGKAEPNLLDLWRNLAAADWGMTLVVPARQAACARTLLGSSNVEIATFNAVGTEGFGAEWAYAHRLAMPRPRNVLIPSIMIGIWLGYKRIILTGADHSWMKSLSVSDDNEVVSIQHHFYAESGREQQRVSHEYRGYHLHQIVESMAVAFRSYHQIASFAQHRGVVILNATPGSFIDAFPRTTLSN